MATTLLDNTITFVKATWPELAGDFTDERIAGWVAEIESGTGRTEAQIRLDILTFIVTDARIDQYVADAFDTRGLDAAAGGESEEERIQRISDELQSGEKTFKGLGDTLDQFGTADTGSSGTETVGGTVIPVGMRLVKVTSPAGSDAAAVFYLVGDVYGVEIGYEVGDIDRLNELYGGPGSFDTVETVNQKQFDNSGILTVGDVDEINGTSESLQAQYERDMREAGLEAPPAWMRADPEAMAVFVTGVNEGWSAERTWTALAATDSFKARFDGIEEVQAQLGTTSIGEAVDEYLNRESEIRDALLRFRGPDADISESAVSSLIGSGWQPFEVRELLELEAEVRGNQEAFDNINDILAFNDLPELSADDFVDFLRDSANIDDPDYIPSDVFEAVNDALRQTALEAAGLDVSDELAASLGTGVSFSIESPDKFNDEAQFVAGVVAANANELDLGEFGLTRDKVVEFFLGDSDDPEVGRQLEKLGRQRGIAAQGFAQSTAFVDAEGRLRTQGFSDV